ncbi:desulfoferrodoxin FeS4 iron-binding domain-containing protein [Candidatus Bipolaricaulota bacterium]
MAEVGKTYVCDLCGQEVEVTVSGAGTLVCCGVPMHAKSS